MVCTVDYLVTLVSVTVFIVSSMLQLHFWCSLSASMSCHVYTYTQFHEVHIGNMQICLDVPTLLYILCVIAHILRMLRPGVFIEGAGKGLFVQKGIRG